MTHSTFAQQKDFRVVAIEETPRQMEASLFASADQMIVKKYLPEGGAPASMSSFVLLAGEDTILFDAGLGGDTWGKKLEAIPDFKPENVKLILLTHLHGDHFGGLLQGNDRRFPHAKVLCSMPEYDHWLPKDGKPRTPQLEKIKAVYGADFSTFNLDDLVFANSSVKVKAWDAVGHTPGHTAFLIESSKAKEENFLIVGDLLHAAALQFPAPEICSRYDMDPSKTIAARKRILDFAAQEKISIAGMHFPSPHIGKVEKNDQGGYLFRADTGH